MNKRHCSKNTT